MGRLKALLGNRSGQIIIKPTEDFFFYTPKDQASENK